MLWRFFLIAVGLTGLSMLEHGNNRGLGFFFLAVFLWKWRWIFEFVQDRRWRDDWRTW
jgi:hypothetical protein